MASLKETADMDDTAPVNANGARYVGPPIDPKTGELKCPRCGKMYAECDCNDDADVHSDNIPDDLEPIKRGQGAVKEDYMDFSDNLSELLLEEFLSDPTQREPAPVAVVAEEKQTFVEQYLAYAQKQGDQLGRKPSDAPVKSSHNPMMKLLYSDHMPPKKHFLR